MPPAQLTLEGWPFVHPGIAAGALGAALIPILIHLINRQRFQKVPWAAMAFLIAANRRSARRVRIEHFILLATRMALILLAGFAIARPFFSTETLGLASARMHRVIVFDQSLSMQSKRPNGQTRFDSGLAIAQKLASTFPQGDGVSLITTAQPVETVVSSPTYDRRFLKEILSGLTPTQRKGSMAEGLDAALKVLSESESPPGNRTVYVISDFPAAEWQSDASGQPSAALRKLRELAGSLEHAPDSIVLARVEPGDGVNLAVTALEPEGGFLSMHAPATFRAEVANFGPSTVRNANIQIRRGSQVIRSETLTQIEPGKPVSLVFSTEFPSPGSVVLEAAVSQGIGDSLPLDDQRFLSVEPRESIPVLIVDGQPGARLIDGQAGYLAVALAPRNTKTSPEPAQWGRSRGNLFDVKVISEPEVSSEPLTAYDVVVLCNVARMGTATWSKLDQFASGGGGVLFTMGSLVSADHYNRNGFVGGKGLTPAELNIIREVDSATMQRLGFQLDAVTNPMFLDFAEHHSSGLFSARVDRYFAVTQVPPDAQIPLRYSNGEPALLLMNRALGKVALWTTSANMEWTNLAGRGDFVAVMAKVVMAITPQHGRHRNLMVGDVLTERLNPQESSMTLRLSLDESTVVEPSLVSDGSGLAAKFGPLERSGAPFLTVGSERREFAVNADPVESRLEQADSAAISTEVGTALRWISETAVPEITKAGASEWFAPLMWIAIGLLILEVWLAQRFSAPHPARQKSIAKEAPAAHTRLFRGATTR